MSIINVIKKIKKINKYDDFHFVVNGVEEEH